MERDAEGVGGGGGGTQIKTGTCSCRLTGPELPSKLTCFILDQPLGHLRPFDQADCTQLTRQVAQKVGDRESGSQVLKLLVVGHNLPQDVALRWQDDAVDDMDDAVPHHDVTSCDGRPSRRVGAVLSKSGDSRLKIGESDARLGARTLKNEHRNWRVGTRD